MSNAKPIVTTDSKYQHIQTAGDVLVDPNGNKYLTEGDIVVASYGIYGAVNTYADLPSPSEPYLTFGSIYIVRQDTVGYPNGLYQVIDTGGGTPGWQLLDELNLQDASEVSYDNTIASNPLTATTVQGALDELTDNLESRAQAGVGSILAASSTISLVYDNLVPQIYGDIIDGSIQTQHLNNGIISNIHIASGANIEWAKIDKTGSKFIDISDTPADYTTAGGYILSVKSTEDGIEFTQAPALSGTTNSSFQIDSDAAVPVTLSWDGTTLSIDASVSIQDPLNITNFGSQSLIIGGQNTLYRTDTNTVGIKSLNLIRLESLINERTDGTNRWLIAQFVDGQGIQLSAGELNGANLGTKRLISIIDETNIGSNLNLTVLPSSPQMRLYSTTDPATDSTQWGGFMRETASFVIAAPDKVILGIANDSADWQSMSNILSSLEIDFDGSSALKLQPTTQTATGHDLLLAPGLGSTNGNLYLGFDGTNRFGIIAENYLDIYNSIPTTNPSANYGRIYTNGSTLYFRDSSGTDYDLTQTGISEDNAIKLHWFLE